MMCVCAFCVGVIEMIVLFNNNPELLHSLGGSTDKVWVDYVKSFHNFHVSKGHFH